MTAPPRRPTVRSAVVPAEHGVRQIILGLGIVVAKAAGAWLR